MIHPTAIIHRQAVLAPSVTVGPYAVIDAHVTVGADCEIGPHVHLTGWTTIGAGNRFHTGCVIGDAPQDQKYKGDPTRLRIGEGNTFREHVTIHRSNQTEEETLIGSGNMFMAHSHIGHNAIIQSQTIIAGGALVAGHVEIQDRAFVSGNCLLHQFVRVGQLAMMQGGAAASQDVPPFTIAAGVNTLCGLNVVGLRRAGVSVADRTELKRLYHRIFRTAGQLREVIDAAQAEFKSEPARQLLEFLANARRGVCRDRRGRRAVSAEPGALSEVAD